MILERIQLRGFGSLRDRDFTFAPGLNLIFGPNEAGKSTLLAAIQALLYGFFRDSNLWAGTAARERYQPWSGGPYGGTLWLRLANGEQYQIERTFSRERATIYRNPGATDVTNSYATGGHGWVDFADRWLGLSPAVFRASALIQQGDLRLTDPAVKVLHAKLETLVDSGGAEQSAQAALTFLEGWLKDRVNPNAHIAERSPLKTLEEAVTNLRADLEASQRNLDDLASLVAEERALAASVATRTEALRTLDKHIAWHEAQTLDHKLAELAELDRSIAAARACLDSLTDVTEVTEALLDDAAQTLAEVSRFAEVVRQERAQVDAESAERQRIDDSLKHVDGELADLSGLAAVSLADLSAAQAAVTAWDSDAARQREAEDAPSDLRGRREEWQASLDPRLVGRTSVDVAQLHLAVNNGVLRADDLKRAVEKSEEWAGSSRLEADYAALESRLGSLSVDDLESIRDLETDYRLAAARHSNRRPIPVVPIGAVAALLGLVVGYVAAGLPGAVAGAIVLGALALVGLSLSSREDGGASVEKVQLALDERLRPYGVASAAELQKLWNERSALRDQLGELRDRRAVVERAQAESERAGAAIDWLIQTTDLDEARRLLALLETWTSRQADFAREERQAESDLAEATRASKASHDRALALLAGLGLAADSPTEAKQALECLSADWERRSELLQSRTSLGARLAGYTARLTALSQNQQKLASAEAEAAARLKAVGIEPDRAHWEEQLRHCRQRFDAYRHYQESLRREGEKRTILIGSDDPTTWAARGSDPHRRGLPPPEGDIRTLDDLRAERADAEAGLAANRERLTRLTTQREEKSSRFADPAELEEQLAEAERRLDRIKRLGDGLRDAKELIRVVAEEQRRDYAPRLEQSLGEWLDRATAGRYAEAKVSPEDLSVKLASAQAGGLVGMDLVSQGTRDVVALLLRVAMVDLLASSDESVPLFLDDPLVNVDAARAERLLAVLRELAERRQIFYLTHDPRIEGCLGANWAGQVHRLAVGGNSE